MEMLCIMLTAVVHVRKFMWLVFYSFFFLIFILVYISILCDTTCH